MQGYYFDAYGRGWGHGVGLCQWGAYGMALQRYNYKHILLYYYPGVEIVDYRVLNPLSSAILQTQQITIK